MRRSSDSVSENRYGAKLDSPGRRNALKSLAIVLQDSSTGGWRYTLRLIEGIKAVRPELDMTAYLGRGIHRIDKVDSPREVLERFGVRVKKMPSLRPIDRRRTSKYVTSVLRRFLEKPLYYRWISDIQRHDMSHFAWPFGIECPPIQKPMVFVPHDFNYTHFVGTFVDRKSDLGLFKAMHQRWIDRAHAIVSSNFIADELMRTFPGASAPRVIPLSQLGQEGACSSDTVANTLDALQIHGDYLLCLNNLSAHKNLGQVIAGFHYAKKRFPNTRLVIAGHGTDGIRGNASVPWYLDHVAEGGDVISLGLRSDEEIKSLIQGARLVINGSVYEAGNGSGLDAWSLGTPVAMSAIPPFLEQMQRLGVHAETFNPRCCYEIGDAIVRLMEDPIRAARLAECSQQAMQRYTWTDVAAQYVDYFERVLPPIYTEERQVFTNAA